MEHKRKAIYRIFIFNSDRTESTACFITRQINSRCSSWCTGYTIKWSAWRWSFHRTSINAGNEPLYVIDGFPIYNGDATVDAGVISGPAINPLSSINPSDIESVDVFERCICHCNLWFSGRKWRSFNYYKEGCQKYFSNQLQ